MPERKIVPITRFIRSHKTGSIMDLTKTEISNILGFKNNFGLSGDEKVTAEWRFEYQGVEMAIWDYKGSAKYKQWSTFGPPLLFKDLFGDNYSSSLY